MFEMLEAQNFPPHDVIEDGNFTKLSLLNFVPKIQDTSGEFSRYIR